MKAIILNEAGSVDKLTYQDIAKPALKSGEILIKTRNIGINPMDVLIRGNEQVLTMFVGSERPAILGWDIAGDVVEKADDVTDFEIGDAVFGITHGKGYAEYVAAQASLMVRKPENKNYKKNTLYYGTIKIRILKGTDLRYRVLGWIAAILKQQNFNIDPVEQRWQSLMNYTRNMGR